MPTKANKKAVRRVFSGIQPSGDLHIGNYLGAIRRWVDMQEEYESMFCIVDLHAITVPQDSEKLRDNIRKTAALLLASGIDPDLSVLFVQSHISAHSELAWILNCMTGMGELSRMTQFKEKGLKQESVSVGLFDYPVLMASDILLYNTDEVPVGEDQKQHGELTRDLARRFNKKYGKTFVVPETVIPKVGARIMSLQDPTKKMSKSEENKNQAIFLTDSPEIIKKKISTATTDSQKDIRFDLARPGIYNLLTIYELFTGLERDAIERHFDGKGYAQFKRELAEKIIEKLAPLQARYKKLLDSPEELDSILSKGAEKIRPIAELTLKKVKEKVGLG